MSDTAFTRLCLDTLTSGAVQSFVDLVYLAAEGSLTLTHLDDVRGGLIAAELGRRDGDAAAVSTSFLGLADRFQAQGKIKVTVFFLEKMLEIAKLTGETANEMRAYHALGFAFENQGDVERALQYHHAHKDLAVAVDDADAKSASSAALVRVYLKEGVAAEGSAHAARALQLYLAAVDASQFGSEPLATAESLYSASRLYVINGHAAEAVPLLQQYVRHCIDELLSWPIVTRPPSFSLQLHLCLASDLPTHTESKAYAALAAANLASDNLDAAIECLVSWRLWWEAVLRLSVLLPAMSQEEVAAAEQADEVALAEAHELLGIIHVRRGQTEDAIRFLHAAYTSRVSLQRTPSADRSRVEKLRMLIGFVKASSELLDDVVTSMLAPSCHALLEWKRAQSGTAPG